MKRTHVPALLLILLACGGPQEAVGTTPVGEGKGGSAADDLDVPDGKGSGTTAESDGTQAGGEGDAKAGPKTAAAVTFRLKNTGKDELVFSLDKGWQPVIFAFSGKPPNAKGIMMFPRHCTAACDLDEGARCPACPKPEKVKDVKAAEKREVIAPGKVHEVTWDGMVHVYKKTRGDRDGNQVKCDCYQREKVPPETYTVRACGLRLTKSAKKSTKYQCIEGSMTFPSDGPQVVEFEFP